MPVASRDLTFIDQLVTLIGVSWSPTSPDEVSRAYVANISEKELNTLQGRKVILFPLEYEKEGVNRGEDQFGYGVGVEIIERYEDADKAYSTAVKTWLDDLLDFVEEEIIDGLDFGKNSVLTFGTREVWTESIDVPGRYDIELLAEKKLFRCTVRFKFRELQ